MSPPLSNFPDTALKPTSASFAALLCVPSIVKAISWWICRPHRRNITIYTTSASAPREAFEIMESHAAQMKANAIIGMRYDATEVMPGCTEVLCYGTAVWVEPVADLC